MRWPGLPRESWGMLTDLLRKVQELSNLRTDETIDLQGGPQPFMTIPRPSGLWARITGGTNPYSAVSVFQKTGGTFASLSEATGASEPYVVWTIATQPLYEVNANAVVPVGSVVWAETHAVWTTDGTNNIEEWQFQYSGAGTQVVCTQDYTQVMVESMAVSTSGCGFQINWKLVKFPCGETLQTGVWEIPLPAGQIGPYVSKVCGEGIEVEYTTKTICGTTVGTPTCIEYDDCCPVPSSSSSDTDCDIELVTCYHLDGFVAGDGTCGGGGCYVADCITLQLTDYDLLNQCYAVYQGVVTICGVTCYLALTNDNVEPYWALDLYNPFFDTVISWEGTDPGQLELQATEDTLCDWAYYMEALPACCECPIPLQCYGMTLNGIAGACGTCDICMSLDLTAVTEDNCTVSYIGYFSIVCSGTGFGYTVTMTMTPSSGTTGNCDIVLSVNCDDDSDSTVFYLIDVPYGEYAYTLGFLSSTFDHCNWGTSAALDGTDCCGSSSSSSSSDSGPYPDCYGAPITNVSTDGTCTDCPTCINVMPDIIGNEGVLWNPPYNYRYRGTGTYCGKAYVFILGIHKANAFPFGWYFTFIAFNNTDGTKTTYSGHMAESADWSIGTLIQVNRIGTDDTNCAWPTALYFVDVCCDESSSSSSSSDGGCGICEDVTVFAISPTVPPITDGTCSGCNALNSLCLTGGGCTWTVGVADLCNNLPINRVATLRQISEQAWDFTVTGVDVNTPLAYYRTDNADLDTCGCVSVTKVTESGECISAITPFLMPEVLSFCPSIPVETCCETLPSGCSSVSTPLMATISLECPSGGCPRFVAQSIQLIHDNTTGNWTGTADIGICVLNLVFNCGLITFELYGLLNDNRPCPAELGYSCDPLSIEFVGDAGIVGNDCFFGNNCVDTPPCSPADTCCSGGIVTVVISPAP